MDPYILAKWMHILSSTVLFGTGMGTAFQMVWAMRSRDTKIVHHVASGVVTADWLFTVPAGLIQPASGLWLIYLQGYSLTEPWLMATYVLYSIAFCCWAPVVGLQIRIRDLTYQANELPAEVQKAYRLWFALGWPAFLALTIVFLLMILKPQFGA